MANGLPGMQTKSRGAGAARQLVIHNTAGATPSSDLTAYSQQLDDRFGDGPSAASSGGASSLAADPAAMAAAAVQRLNERDEQQQQPRPNGGGAEAFVAAEEGAGPWLVAPRVKWLSEGLGKTHSAHAGAVEERAQRSGGQEVALSTYLIGKEIVAPLVARLIYAAGCLQQVGSAGGSLHQAEGDQAVVSAADADAVVGEAEAEMEAEGEAAGEASERRIARVLDHVRSLAQEVVEEGFAEEAQTPASAALSRLAVVEARLLRENEAGAFDDLRVPQRSLVAFLASHADGPLAATLLPAAADGGVTAIPATAAVRLRDDASRLLASLEVAMPDGSDAAKCDALVSHFASVSAPAAPAWTASSLLATLTGATPLAGVARDAPAVLDELRHLQRADAFGSPAPLLAATVLAARFACTESEGASPELQPRDLWEAAALDAALDAPLLTDMAASTHWRRAFEPTLGPLRDWCASRPSVAATVLELTHGAVVRIEAGRPADFAVAVRALDATRAVAIGAHLCAGAQGAAAAVIEPMRREVEAALAAVSQAEALRFTAACLDALPGGTPPSLLRLTAALFLSPLKAVLPAACRSLAAATTACQRPRLHHLGELLGEVELLMTTTWPHARGAMAHAKRATTQTAPSGALMEDDDDAARGSRMHSPHTGFLGPPPSGSAEEGGQQSSLAATLPSGCAQFSSADEVAAASNAPPGVPLGAADDEGCEEVCTAIARKFGSGIEAGLDAAGREALGQLRAVTMRSIQRLAAELYGGNAHFLLELVQNGVRSRALTRCPLCPLPPAPLCPLPPAASSFVPSLLSQPVQPFL